MYTREKWYISKTAYAHLSDAEDGEGVAVLVNRLT